MIRITFLILLIIHGFIHLLGFMKGFHFAEIAQLRKKISKAGGVLWLLTALLLLTTSLLFILGNDNWWIAGFVAAGISQLLIINSWSDARFGSLANFVIVFVCFAAFAHTSYYNTYKRDVKLCFKQKDVTGDSLLNESDLLHLPTAVQKYLRYVGVVGKPKVKNFKVEFNGRIRKNEKSAWMPFTSEQYNFVDVPARLFFMKAVMSHLPVDGYHHFIKGHAVMDIRLLSLFKVQYQDGAEMDQSETVTYFNDMCCMAPATLIDKRITWLNEDGNRIKASFTLGDITITAWLFFNEKGELINFVSNDRYAADAGKKLPWSTPLFKYKEMNGYKLASSAKAIYTYPEGEMCYGTFDLKKVVYNTENFN